ncbi:MAG: M56 family metallopeptidase [Steroidobacteraceae bacterium]
MLYLLVLALLLSGAGLAAEYAARSRGARSRWIWAVTILASLTIPVLVSSVSIQAPDLGTPTVSHRLTALRELTSVHIAPLRWVQQRARDAAAVHSENRMLLRIWIAVSLAILAALAVNHAHLVRRRRRWKTGTVGGVSVHIAPDVGPAVVGFLRPRIVVPQWLLEASLSRQAMAVAHEQAHLAKHDPQLLTVTLCLVVLMPWNFPLWWQLYRLRLALEIDCDARVLERGVSKDEYREMLIAVSQRPAGYISAAVATAESRLFLEKRIAFIFREPKSGSVATVLLSALALSLVAVASQVTPPVAGSDDGPVTLTPAVLDQYVGFYVRGAHLVHAVTRDGTRLFMQIPDYDYDRTELVADSPLYFTAAGIPITFVRDAQGQVTGLVQHNADAPVPMPRVDAPTARAIMVNNDAKYQSQTPTAGSYVALRRLVDGVLAGKPDYDQMTPWYAQLAAQMVRLDRRFTRMGAVQSIEFRGVNTLGDDVYEVHQEGGISTWMIVLDSNGRIEDADSYVW